MSGDLGVYDKMKNKSAVAIVRVSEGNIAEAMEKLILYLGGMDRIIAPFDTVLIKPNWATDKEYTSGAVTHPEVIRKCTQMLLGAGVRKVIVGDSSIIGKDTLKVIEINGLSSLESKRVEIKDFKKSETVSIAIPNALRYRRISFPKEVMDCDVIINIPVMKTHDCLPVTLGLKNMKGLVSDRIKRRIHSIGLEEAIIDINRVVLADLTIIDGIIGMEGNGPLDGTPLGMNVLIGSFDPLAAETVAIKAMGFEPETMNYINMAYQAGFGEIHDENIDIVGEKLDEIKRRFKTDYYCRKSVGNSIYVDDVNACSACRNIINMFLKEDASKHLGGRKGTFIFAGAYREYSDICGCNKLGIGNCLAGSKDKFNMYVPGCPPTKRNIISAFKKLVE